MTAVSAVHVMLHGIEGNTVALPEGEGEIGSCDALAKPRPRKQIYN